MAHDETNISNENKELLESLPQQLSEEDAADFEEFGKELDTYAWYLYYRVERSLYEIVKEEVPDLTWKELVGMFLSRKDLCDAARTVLSTTLQDFLDHGSYDFSVAETHMLSDADEQDKIDGKMNAASLLPTKEKGRSLVTCIIENAFRAYARERGLDVELGTLTQEQWDFLSQSDGAAQGDLMRGVRYALSQLDFASAWQSQGVESLAQFCEKPAKADAQNQIPVSELPFQFPADVEKQYGKIHYAEKWGPGVYFIATNRDNSWVLGGEYLVATSDSPVISDKAHAYGTPLPTNPITYLYSYNEYFDKGRWVVEYEVHKYLTDHGIPLPEDESLQNDIARGMEVCPEYFGEFPIPMETPWGAPIQADKVSNGVFWLKTEQEGWVLALAYPICDDINEQVLDYAVLTQEDQERGIDNTCGLRFFRKQDSCLPLLELIEFTNPSWAGKFSLPAIKNAILESFPDYARNYNENIAALEERIEFDADAGTEFYHFPD